MSAEKMEKINVSLTGRAFNEENAIVVAGHQFDIGTRVFNWSDPNGFNGYTTKRVVVPRENRRTGEITRKEIAGRRYSKRKKGLQGVKQFFVHHSGGDGADPTNMYRTLYFDRKLSVHYAVEDDGRLYQFNDALDCCWHAGGHNGYSIGVECCLFPLASERPNFYSAQRRKRTGNLKHRKVRDVIHGRVMEVFAMTDPQLEALARLAAGNWLALAVLGGPRRVKVDGVPLDNYFSGPPCFPRNVKGKIPQGVFRQHAEHVGLIGHLQCTKNKIDPAGFPWEDFEILVHERYNDFVLAYEGEHVV